MLASSRSGSQGSEVCWCSSLELDAEEGGMSRRIEPQGNQFHRFLTTRPDYTISTKASRYGLLCVIL